MMTVTVGFHDTKRDRSVEAAVHRWVERLELAGVRIDDCSVMITSGHHTFAVDLDLALQGGLRFEARPDPARRGAHADVYVAVSDAFRTAWRQICGPLAGRTQPMPVLGPSAEPEPTAVRGT